ncbi:MAG: Ig-like domain-containing protein [Acutalibacteraceae bacterium]
MKKSKKLLALFLVSTLTLGSALSVSAVDAQSENQSAVSSYVDKGTAESLQVESDKNSTVVQSNATNDKVILNTSNATTKVGSVVKLKATLSATSSSSLKWESSNCNIASVDKKGNVMGISAGEATVSCTSSNGATAVCNVSVLQPATSVVLNAHSISWNVGKSAHFNPVVGPTSAENKKVVYKSSNTKIATVSNSGLLTAVSPGTCVVTCSSAENSKVYDTCTVTVKKPNTSITLSKSSVVINNGTSHKLTASVKTNSTTNKISWKSSNTAVATVSSTGNITTKTNGTCVITATSNDGSGALAKCSVTVVQPVTDIKLSTTNLKLNINTSATLSSTVTPVNATTKTVRYSSSNTSVATVTNKGIIKAVGVGACTITAKTVDGSNKIATCTVVVNQPVTNVTLNTHSISWNVGKSAHFRPTVTPTNASNIAVTYTSSNPEIATVNSNGLLTAVSAGTCTITCTATDGSGKYDTCKVTVKQPVTKVTLNTHSITWNVGKSAHFRPTVTPTNASNIAVTYTSSNPNVATVSSKGLLTAVSAGTCTITCTALDGSGKFDTCTVTVKQPAPTGQQIADYAAQWVGVTQYVWGGTNILTGVDCSGFVCSVYEQFGYNLWNSRVDLDTVGYSVPLSEAKPGDILVFYGHVGIYAGNGKVTHALNEYYDVLTTDLSWGGTLRCVRRVVD